MIHGVAISGRAGAGKSELGGILADLLGGRRLSFAGPLKADCFRDWGITKEMPGGREALNRYGEERRSKDSYYWIDRLYPSVQEAWAGGRIPIIDDLRFPDEYDAVQDWGFQTVRIRATDSLRRARLEAAGHDPSVVDAQTIQECSLDHFHFDHTLLNLGSHMQLRTHAGGLTSRLFQASIRVPSPCSYK